MSKRCLALKALLYRSRTPLFPRRHFEPHKTPGVAALGCHRRWTMSLGLILIILVIFLLGGFSGRFGGYGYGYGQRGMGGRRRHSHCRSCPAPPGPDLI